jgi:Holliday junction resolvase RusA-like endonuclease
VSKAKRTCKRTAMLVARSRWTQVKPMEKARVFITWDSATHQAPDPDNVIACLKAAFDGLEAAGVIRNDRDLIPMPPTIRRKQAAPAVTLDIEEIE